MKHLIFNLKANKNYDEMVEYLNAIEDRKNIVILPTMPFLNLLNKDDYIFGVQDISEYDDSNISGEVTANQVKSMGAQYALVGHSSRRLKCNEDELSILKKINNAYDAKLKVIYCIGETIEERMRHKTYQIIEKQIARIFNNLSEKEQRNIIIAYEPVWAIGNGNAATNEDVSNITSFIKKIVYDYYNIDVKVLYGGSVNTHNIYEFVDIETVDGFLVGKASLDINEVNGLVKMIK